MHIKFMTAALALAAIFTVPSIAEAAEATNGETSFKAKCALCHESNAGKHKVGPSLFGVAGRKAGAADGFQLYRGLKDADWTWDDSALDAYLSDPVQYTKDKTGKSAGMVLKLTSAQERADVIAFLKTLK